MPTENSVLVAPQELARIRARGALGYDAASHARDGLSLSGVDPPGSVLARRQHLNRLRGTVEPGGNIGTIIGSMV